MQAEARQRRIEEYLARVEFASLEELAKDVDASISTVRRDLTALEAKGNIRRTHGGARLVNPRSDEFAFASRDTHQLDEKEAIGRACAELILPNQTIIVDAGTTCFHIARHLESKTPHIVTNSLPVAHHFSSAPKLEVVVSGGVIYPRLGVLVGPMAVASFRQIHADAAIMSCGGITADGVMNSHALLIDIQRVMMQAANRVILCLDHTKFGRQSISRLCGLEEIDTLISDQAPPDALLSALKGAGVEVAVATATGLEILHPGRTRPRVKQETPSPAPTARETSLAPPASDTPQAEAEDSFID